MSAAAYQNRLAQKRKAIHVKRRQLALDDDVYRTILQRVAGVSSSADLTLHYQADAVLAELDRLGAPIQDKEAGGEWRFVFRATPSRQRYLKKIYKLAKKIGKKQKPPVPAMSKAYIEGILAQSHGRDGVIRPLEFVDEIELLTLIQMLGVHDKRHVI